jgi:hypothetical protein
MSVGSFLKKAGTDLEKVLGVVVKVGVAEEPIIDAAFPGFATVINAGLAEAAKVLALSTAAAATGITAEQQVIAIAEAVEPALVSYAASLGLPAPTAAKINAVAQAIFDGVNASGATVPATAAAAPAVPIVTAPVIQAVLTPAAASAVLAAAPALAAPGPSLVPAAAAPAAAPAAAAPTASQLAAWKASVLQLLDNPPWIVGQTGPVLSAGAVDESLVVKPGPGLAANA